MNNSQKLALAVVVVAVVIAILHFYPVSVTNVGVQNPIGPAHYQLEPFYQGIQLGSRGTPLSLYASGTCTLQGNFSITATTTRSVSCTGVTLRDNTTYVGAAGDIVDMQLVASTTMASQYVIKSAQASTTVSGSIEAQIVNLTGGNATPSGTPGMGSSTQFQIFR